MPRPACGAWGQPACVNPNAAAGAVVGGASGAAIGAAAGGGKGALIGGAAGAALGAAAGSSQPAYGYQQPAYGYQQAGLPAELRLPVTIQGLRAPSPAALRRASFDVRNTRIAQAFPERRQWSPPDFDTRSNGEAQ